MYYTVKKCGRTFHRLPYAIGFESLNLILLVSAILLVSILYFEDLSAATTTEQEINRDIPYVLTISGGISLGAYESGLNWALLKYLKVNQSTNQSVHPSIAAVTGASAGSINGLISVISWCVDEEKLLNTSKFQDSIANNLFRDIWVDVGLDTLLPEDKNGFLPDDGLFTRNAFEVQLSKINSILNEKIFKSDCDVPFGMTVTGELPNVVKIAGIPINNQRYFIPTRFIANDSGQANFKNYPVMENNTNFGNIIYLPPISPTAAQPELRANYIIDNQSVIDATLASSAFPVAFGRKKLEYCSPTHKPQKFLDQAPHVCPADLTPRSDIFIDGGLFDNIPLGSAKELAEQELIEKGRRVNYIFIDPDNRRPKIRTTKSTNSKIAAQSAIADLESINLVFNLANQIGFLSGAIGTARSYELYKVLTNGDWTNQSFRYTDALARLLDKSAASNQPINQTNQSIDYHQCDNFINSTMQANSTELKSNAVNTSWLKRAKYCLLENSRKLDFNYQYQAMKSSDLVNQRLKHLEYMSTLARLLAQKNIQKKLTMAKLDPLGDRRILLSSRFYPLTASYLSNFGAFFDRPFREFDYYVGVYDAVHDIANHICQFRQTRQDAESVHCTIGGQAQKLYTLLGIQDNSDAAYVFNKLAREEHQNNDQFDPHWEWINTELKNDSDKQQNEQLITISKALKGNYADNILHEPEFDIFIKSLGDNYQSDETSEYFKYILSDNKDWWLLPSVRATNRLLDLELASSKDGKNSVFQRPLFLASKITEHLQYSDDYYDWRQPYKKKQNKYVEWLPYEVGIGAHPENMPYLAWEPTFSIIGFPLFAFKLTPWQSEDTDNAHGFYQTSLVYMHTDHQSYQLGASFDVNGRWKKRAGYDRITSGLSLNVKLFNTVRVTVGFRDFLSNFSKHNSYVNIGLIDLASKF